MYCVSSLGVTGVRSEITTNIKEMVDTVKQGRDVPCAIGFGISTPEQAGRMASQADGVIVGSAHCENGCQIRNKLCGSLSAIR